MNANFDPDLLLSQIRGHLGGLAAFWRERGIDPSGGYNTVFDPSGRTIPTTYKTLVAQTRILWTCSSLASHTGDESWLTLAKHGYDYLLRSFYDDRYGGWFWSVDSGGAADEAKLMYGQTFALYALCAYASASGDAAARDAAAATFDSMHATADVRYGGFWENVDRRWAPEDSESGRRKSLDIHLHLMESFTSLARLTGDPTHRRRLAEVRALLLDRMIDPVAGVGGNQYSHDWTPLEPMVIDRTWIAERTTGARAPGAFTTSYGHNLELGWLLGDADEVLDGDRTAHVGLVDHMAAHTLKYGFDAELGGVYREGPPLGAATDTDKEFWQNAEALIGFLHAFEVTNKREYAEAFAATWSFARAHLIHPELAEWRIRTTRTGTVVDDSLGNQWTGGYHTVRAALECVKRLERLQKA